MSKKESGQENGAKQLGADELSAFNEYQSSQGFDVLPLYEKSQYEFVNLQKYSMRTNGKLYSRWREYVKTGKMPTSTQKSEYNTGHFHFHNCVNKYLPSQSISNYPSLRYQLKPGPGCDKYGEKPIPDDMMMRKFKRPLHSVGKNKTKTAGR